ncbi:MAG: methyltransferase [Mogibacterium sp.]|nr:methyltransferase [Mogibacterium sp.]
MAEVPVRADERIDDTGFGGVRVIQGGGFSYGVDAVLLASFLAERLTGRSGQSADRSARPVRVCDLGTGNGIIPLILSHKAPQCRTVGIEVDPDAYSRAVRSVRLNDLDDRIMILHADINDIYESITQEAAEADAEGAEETAGAFDVVVTNPPYFRRGAAILNEQSAKARARHETTAGLADFLRLAELLLRQGGDFYMIHRPDRLVDVLSEMRTRGIEPKELQMITPRQGEAANLVLIHGVKGAGPELRLLPEQAVHGPGQEYTDWINRIYER